MGRKIRIFIGSSSETKGLAEKIKMQIQHSCECYAWYDDFFELGGYVYNDLIKKAITYDYAILIGGIDDKVIRIQTQAEKYSPRDNIYLEYGMFSGILSTNRILFLIHNDCKVASDLAGMTLKTYSDEETAVNISDQWIKDAIGGDRTQLFSAHDIELLPTVGIAVGYFHNFLVPFLESISSAKSIEFNGNKYDIATKKLIVSTPAYLESGDNAMGEYIMSIKENLSLENAMISNYRVMIDPAALANGNLVIYDIPNTILSVFKTIDFIFNTKEGMDDEDSANAKYRALDNFSDNLIRLMETKKRLSKLVEFRRLDN